MTLQLVHVSNRTGKFQFSYLGFTVRLVSGPAFSIRGEQLIIHEAEILLTISVTR